MADNVAVDDIGVYMTSDDLITYTAAIEAATDPGELAAVVATYLDPTVGGHWGTLPPQ